MEIILLNNSFDVCGIAEEFSEFEWHLRYSEVGDFSLTLPQSYKSIIDTASFIYSKDDGICGIIEKIRTENGAVTLSGRMLEALFDQRVINGTEILSGNLESEVLRLVNTYAISGDRAIGILRCDSPKGYTETVSVQVTGKRLMSFLYELLSAFDMSYRITYDYIEGSLLFSLCKGKDLSQDQTENNRMIFSSSFGNIADLSYSFNEKNSKNYAFVAGEGVGAERTVVEVDKRISSDQERREIFVNASDIRKTIPNDNGEDTVISDEDYCSMLTQRGLEKLALCPAILSVSAKLVDSSYREVFSVGDICDFHDPVNEVSQKMRVSHLHGKNISGATIIYIDFVAP